MTNPQTKNFAQAGNPVQFWQDAMAHWMPTTCTASSTGTDKPSATLEPFAFSKMMGNPMMAPLAFWQQSMAFWQGMMTQGLPQQPATPKLTFDMGDMTAYMQPAMQMMQQWQSMWMKGMGK